MSFKNTAAALEQYDREIAQVEILWANAETSRDVLQAQRAETQLEEMVSEAFFEDTKGINCRENCMLVKPGPAVPPPGQELSWLRTRVAKWAGNLSP